MIKKQIQLSSISINKVIVHTLPKHKKGDTEIEPKYSEKVSQLTFTLKQFFKDKIVSSLGSDRAIRLAYDKTSVSPISTIAKSIISLKDELAEKALVSDSKKIAKYLFETQMGANNEGILVVVPCKVNQANAVILIKLEMDSGAQLVLNGKSKSYDIKEVEDLMLTKKTKVYKVAMLLNKSLQGVAYDGIITDHQIDAKAKDEVKSWFINRFLGCVPFEDPKIVTQHFYNYTKAYIDIIDDDIKRAKYHQDLNSYIQKNQSIISPREFADDYLTNTDERNNYKNFLIEKGIGFDGFQKDVSQIQSKINKMTIEFANDIILTTSTGTFEDKVKLEKTASGQTKAIITSRIKRIK